MSRARRQSPMLDTLERRQLLSIVRPPTDGKGAVIAQPAPVVNGVLVVAPTAPALGTAAPGVQRSTGMGQPSAVAQLLGRTTFPASVAVQRSTSSPAVQGPNHLNLPSGGAVISRGTAVAPALTGGFHITPGIGVLRSTVPASSSAAGGLARAMILRSHTS